MITAIGDYLVRMLPGIFPAALIFFCLLPLRKKCLQRAALFSPFPREVFLLLFMLFCGGMAVITLTPRWFHWLTFLQDGSAQPYFCLGTVNLIPFRTFSFDWWSVMILTGNLIMFAPFGFFSVLLWRNVSLKRTLFIGLPVSLFIEISQLFIGRTFDIDDIMLNTLGVLLGGLFCRVLFNLAASLTVFFHVQNK